ncbi:ATP-binding protein [Paucibacter sp. M5-1]|uniref:ATP-binding protein n=1 Tax=Paucibacter sp. M5-1 TaxID=3015998 RepID=UPI0022B8C897|nr:winged helix-turn-helix domain-containing protein [Paucibacter sp. M5-1]MCZ7880611.1 winged helix-turn-helix domain-containing protein [Paucibacter sp. M5-1]
MQPQAWQFGTFTLLPRQRLLLDGDSPVCVGGRALDLLIVLIEAAGSVVPRSELITRVWKNVIVDEGSLRVHIAALRRVLRDDGDGQRFIVNVPGQGYSFIGEVLTTAVHSVNTTWPKLNIVRSPLPPLLTRVVGRDEAIRDVSSMVAEHRLVTIVGAGGVGKTTVAVAAATQLAAVYRDGARFVDLAPLTEPRHVASACANAIGESSQPIVDASDLAGLLAGRQMLIVLDNCEHVVEAVATLVEALLASAPGVHLLATSREPIRAPGEHVFRLASLELPPASGPLTAEQAAAFAAVQLFTQRTAASFTGFKLLDEHVPYVTEICWRLDGIPLAIELAAGRVEQLGVRGLSLRLEDSFAVLTKGRRTALPRQQTLRAAIEWSYELLTETQKSVLMRLSVFAGSFSFDSALAVCEDELSANSCDAIDELVLKSLITIDSCADVARYRLLEMTRAYALDKLRHSGDLAAAYRSHAQHVCSIFEGLEAGSPLDAGFRDTSHGRWIDDIQIAVQASFSTLRDPGLAMRLLAVTASVWFQRSLISEYRARAEEVLERASELPLQHDATAMRFWHALGLVYWYTGGSVSEVAQVFGRTYDLARALRDVDFERMALWGLCVERCGSGSYGAALDLAQRHAALTPSGSGSEAEIQSGHMMQVCLHLMGDQQASRNAAIASLQIIHRTAQSGALNAFQPDPRAAINSFLSRTLWIQGLPDQALEVAAGAVQSARSMQHAVTLCFTLFGQCAVLLWCGRWLDLEREANELMEVARDRRLIFWETWAQAYKDALAVGAEGVVVPKRRYPILGPHHAEVMATVSDELLEGDALIRAEAGQCPWCAPEVFRAQGEKLLRQGAASHEAERWFLRALRSAQESKAYSWELRAATSLAGSWLRQNRRAEAEGLLSGVLGRFTEGFDTLDLQRARRMLKG